MKDKLWCDLKSFKEKANFIQLGRAVETGIIAPAMQSSLSHDYNALVIAVKENEQLRDENQAMKDILRDAIGLMRATSVTSGWHQVANVAESLVNSEFATERGWIMSIDDLLKFVFSLAEDHKPDGWPAIQMKGITPLADEILKLREQNKALRNYIAALMRTMPKIKAATVREALENTPNHRLHGEARLFHTQSSLLHYADKLEQGECLNTAETSKKEIVREFLDSVIDADQLSGRDTKFLVKFADIYFGDEE